MTQKSPSKPISNGLTKVIVFGVDDDAKPHAAWFGKDHADAARTIARQLRFNVIAVTSGKAADFISKVAAGRVHGNGSTAVPTIQNDVYEKIVAAINPRGEAGQEPNAPVVTDLPANWDAIKPGHLVLYHESLVDGWWEAIVVDRASDKITIRLRDYPSYPKFTVRAAELALLNPTAA
jgi:hypothetical protein